MAVHVWLLLLHIFFIQGLESHDVRSIYLRQKRLVNGDDAVPGEFPYQVSIQNIESDYHHCGGTIIDEYHVLTAAHCLDGLFADEFKVISGTIDLRKPFYTHYVSDIYVHENFTFESPWIHDIALLKLTQPIVFKDNVSPANLPKENEDILVDTSVIISGFGRLGLHTYTSKVLKKAEIIIKSLKYCNEKYLKTHIQLTGFQICAYDSKPKGICQGDSGGPLTMNHKVVGISSYTMEGCADTNYPSVFTKISNYIKWIQKYTRAQ